jgi:hypothetical protein
MAASDARVWLVFDLVGATAAASKGDPLVGDGGRAWSASGRVIFIYGDRVPWPPLSGPSFGGLAYSNLTANRCTNSFMGIEQRTLLIADRANGGANLLCNTRSSLR